MDWTKKTVDTVVLHNFTNSPYTVSCLGSKGLYLFTDTYQHNDYSYIELAGIVKQTTKQKLLQRTDSDYPLPPTFNIKASQGIVHRVAPVEANSQNYPLMFSEREFLFYDSTCEIIPFQIYPSFGKNVLDKREKFLKPEEQRNKFRSLGGFYQSYA